MDGRDFGPPRSMHEAPSLLSGLAMETHRLGAAAAGATAGRIAPSPGHLGAGHAVNLYSGKYLPAAINLHSQHGDAFSGSSTPFLGSYVGSSHPHGAPTPMPSDSSFRAPSSTNLQMTQLWALHPHEGFPPLPSSLYSSPYLPLGAMEAPSSSPLHAQLGQHTLFDSQKDVFYLPSHPVQPTLHSHPPTSRTPAVHIANSASREKEVLSHPRGSKDSAREASREKPYKSESGPLFPRRDKERPREEARPRSVVDLTQEVKVEEERRPGGSDRPFRSGGSSSPFLDEHPHMMSGEPKLKHLPAQASLSGNCRSISGGARCQGPEQERCDRPVVHEEEELRAGVPSLPDKPKKCDTVVVTAASVHVSCGCPSPHSNPPQPPHRLVFSGTNPPPSLYCPHPPAGREAGKEHRVIAPTFVPSVEVYERNGPIQIASQARDNKNDKVSEKNSACFGGLQVGPERTLMDPLRSPYMLERVHGDGKRVDLVREEGSVIRSNSLPAKRPLPPKSYMGRPGHSPDARDLTSSTAKDVIKVALESEYRSQERERVPRSSGRDSAKVHNNGMDPARVPTDQQSLKGFPSTDLKWKPFEMGNYASNQMAVLVAQHGLGNRADEEGKKAYLDSPMMRGPAGAGVSEGPVPGARGEVSAMQSLIKYSGSFTKEPNARHGSDTKYPFGGLGSVKLETSSLGGSKAQPLPPPQPTKQLKRDPERPESAKSFGRESIGPQGEVEVRHPPVGIAVAVARQRDSSSSTSKPSSSLVDRDRPLLVGSIKASGRPQDDRGDERVRHRDDRLLAGRLEKEQEKLLRESKELAEYTQMHPPVVSAGGLNPNLMVTGGASLTGPGRWPLDPGSHPWVPRAGGSHMWLPSSHYGLGPPSLHQSLPPGYPPALPGAIPPSYQFARDPQSGQLLVIPTEHLPHYAAELMERAPPLWPAMYPPAGSALQHAHQLQILSHQQLLRQQELYMIQQQAAQVLELQRSAQFVERLKASEQRAELEDKTTKRNGEGSKEGLSTNSAPSLHPRKPPPPCSPTASTSYGKALNLLPLPSLSSPISALKSEGQQKSEVALTQQSYSHSSTPTPNPPSPASASPPPPSPPPSIPPKEESVQEGEKKELDLQKKATSPFQTLYSEIPPGYPYQSISVPFGSHYPYLLQPAAAADADGLAPDVPLPAGVSDHLATPGDIKPVRTRSPVVVEPLHASRPLPPTEESPALKQEPDLEDSKEGLCQEAIGPLCGRTASPSVSSHDDAVASELEGHHAATCLPEVEAVNERRREKVKEEEISVQSCEVPPCQSPSGPVPATPSPKITEVSVSPRMTSFDLSSHYEKTQECHVELDLLQQAASPAKELECNPSVFVEPSAVKSSNAPGSSSDGPFLLRPCSPTEPPPPDHLNVTPENPMAGMIALVAASELPQAGPVPEVPWDGTSLEGMVLLSQMAMLELEKQSTHTQRQTVHLGLDILLEAGRQVLQERQECSPTITLRLPRELKANKKYSWMQRKDEPLYSKSGMEAMDATEVDFRMKLAELQRRYKDKQRELMKLQRRRDCEEKQEEKSKNFARRGPGRPRKRKNSLCALTSPMGKLDPKCTKFSRSLLLSEDSETGEVPRKRFRGPSLDEDEELENSIIKVQTKGTKKRKVSEQELASKLDKALSLTRLGKMKTLPFKFVDGQSGKSQPVPRSCSKLHNLEMKPRVGKQGLSKGFPIYQKLSKGCKSKNVAETKGMESCLKIRGQRKASFSPARSEISSYSNNTDSEEEEEDDDKSMKQGWLSRPLLSRDGSRTRGSSQSSAGSRKSRPRSKRGSSSGTVKPKRVLGKTKHRHFALLLQEAEAYSSEDSFDQGY